MVISQTELKAEVIESSTKAFETFFKDMSDMFNVNLECTQQEVSGGTIDDIKKRFGGPVAVNTVKAQGVLDGVFQLIFDQEGLCTLSGVLIMLPEEQIQENRKNNSVEYTQELTDTLAEAGNLLVGAWDRVFRENIEGHGDFTRTNNFIGEPWDEPEAKIGLSENTELVVVPYEMTLGSSPACNCGVIFPKALLGETSEADTQPASEEQKTTNEEQPLAEEETAAEDEPSAEQQVPAEEEASAKKQSPVKKKTSPKEKASAKKQAPAKKKTSPKEKASAKKRTPVKKKAAPEEPSAEQQPTNEGEAPPEEASSQQETPVEQESTTEEKPSAEQQAPVEENPAPEEEPSAEEQTPAEEEIPAEKGEDETVVAEESKEPAGGEISETIQRMTQSQSESPTEDASSTIEENQVFATVGISSAVCAKDIMQKDVAWGSADDNVQQALTTMQQADSGYIMIGGDGKPQGIVSKSDITGAISPYLRPIFEKWRRPLDDATLQIKVKLIMSRPVHTIKPETSLVNIMQTMQQLGLRALPVMDQQGHILGIVTVFDIIKTMLGHNSQTAVAGKTSQAPPLA